MTNPVNAAKKLAARRRRFYYGTSPKLVRCYDLGPSHTERFTVVFTGAYRKQFCGQFMHLGMSSDPFHPQGIGNHGFSDTQIDRPRYSHLGKRIAFNDLPTACQQAVQGDYDDIWALEMKPSN